MSFCNEKQISYIHSQNIVHSLSNSFIKFVDETLFFMMFRILYVICKRCTKHKSQVLKDLTDLKVFDTIKSMKNNDSQIVQKHLSDFRSLCSET